MTAHEIMMVDDDPVIIRLMSSLFSGLGKLRFATNGADTLRLARANPPSLLILDAQMPGMSGFELFEHLKADKTLAGVPVIFVTSHTEADFEISALESGAVDFVRKPINPALLVARVKARLKDCDAAGAAREEKNGGVMPGVLPRARFEETLRREWLRGARDGSPLALALVEIDHFPAIANAYGPAAAEAAQRMVLQAMMRAKVRPADVIGCNHADEFALLLPQTPRDGAEVVAQRILDFLAPRRGSPDPALDGSAPSVNIGVAYYDQTSDLWVLPSADRRSENLHRRPSAEDLVLAADTALSEARRSGGAGLRLMDVADVCAVETER